MLFVRYLWLLGGLIVAPFSFCGALNYDLFAREYFNNELKEMFHQPEILEEVKAQNRRHENLDVKAHIEQQVAWQKKYEAKDFQGYLDMSYTYSSLTALQAKFNAQGLIFNVIVTDKYGQSLAQALFSEQFWFRDVYHKNDKLLGANIIDLKGVDYDPLSRSFIVRAIYPLYENNKMVGSVVVVFDAEEIDLYIRKGAL